MDAIAEQLLARLRSDPRDRDAYDALRAHFVHGQDFPALANLLESWALAHPDDREGSSDAWTEAADAVLQSGGDRNRAKVLYRRALELNVLHPRAGDRLRELLETDTDFQGLIDVLEPYARALETAGGAPTYIAGLYQRLAELWQHAFNRPDLAASYRERADVLRTRPHQSMPAAQDDPRSLAADLEQRAAGEAAPARRAALLSELARVRDKQLGDVEGALEALRQARSLAPNDALIMHQLATALITHAPRTDAQAARVAHRRASELFYQVAQAVDPSEALQYLESALAATPDHEGSLALLERMAPDQGRAEMLPPYWVRFLAAAGDGPESDRRRVWLGRAYLRSDQLEDAIYCLQPAAEHRFEGATELLQQAYERLGSAPIVQPQRADVQPGFGRPDGGLSGSAPAPQPAPSGIAELRKAVRNALAARRSDEAAEHCRAILAIDPGDGEAFNLLESHLRKRADYAALKPLLLASARAPTLSHETRRARLREVALLCEGKLRDPQTALDAWREVVKLDAGDRDAASSFKRLLHRAQAWDELSATLEREALATTDPAEKVAHLRELLQLHREQRGDVAQAAEALRRLHALAPNDPAVRAELCELLLALEHFGEAVPVLRECIAHAADELEELRYSHALARILHERLGAHDEAYRTCARILEFKPGDHAAFELMERIDAESGNHARLLQTLERRALLATKAERPALLLRMGSIAETELRDLERAAQYLSEALDLEPDDTQALERLCEMFERAGRFERLLEWLRVRSAMPLQPKTRAALLRRMARLCSEQLHDEQGAAANYRTLLTLEEDEHALRYLREFAGRHGHMPELADLLRRLAQLSNDLEERRELLLERANLLHERLGALTDAISTLRDFLEHVDPSFEPAIDLLTTLSARNRDSSAFAFALERRLDKASDAAARLQLLEKLSDVYERDLGDAERAAFALQLWSREDPPDPRPHRRLRPLLGGLGRWAELLSALDALREHEPEPEARDEAALEAARVACDRLGDVQGAWRRLLPLVETQNASAVALLHDIARQHQRQAQLAALYVRLAQRSDDPMQQARHWLAAATVFEDDLHEPSQAFEASLRLLATDLDNLESLARVDRLALATGAFRRLNQVYDRLLKHSVDPARQLALMCRLARLLEADQPDEALERWLGACRLEPLDGSLLERVEALAQRTRRQAELLPVYERRAERLTNPGERIELLLRAARLSDGALRDREQAETYFRKCVEIVIQSRGDAAAIEATARELDAARPELGRESARRALAQLYREAALRAPTELAESLLTRGASLLRDDLGDERGAFDLLVHGIGSLPESETLYETVRAMANTRGRLDAIDSQLARMLEDATDLPTTVRVLRRRGALLEGALERHHDAAAVYAKLAALSPEDGDARKRLRANLRRSGRHQELLLALRGELEHVNVPAERVTLLKEIATTWENDLKNRWEALDAWRAVLLVDPKDADAGAGVIRAGRPNSQPAERESGTLVAPAPSPAAAEKQPAPAGGTSPLPRASGPMPRRSAPPPPRASASPQRPSRPNIIAVSPAAPIATPKSRPEQEAASHGRAEDDTTDDLSALDAALGARVPELDDLDNFDTSDDEALAEVDVREALPLPPATTRASSPMPPLARTSPLPPPLPTHGGAPTTAKTTTPPPPENGEGGASTRVEGQHSAPAPGTKPRPPRPLTE